jgi:lipopolysaccharide heptosyltransferase II
MQTELRDLSRILVVRLDNIGDMVMTGPALRALRKAYPLADITMMASPAGQQVTPFLPWIDNVIAWRAIWQDISNQTVLNPNRELRLVEMLKNRHFDAALILTSFTQSPHPVAYACYLAGIPIRIGQSKEFGGALLTHWTKPKADRNHQVDRNLHLLEFMGVPLDGTEMELHLPTAARENAMQTLLALGIQPGDPYVVMAPGASCASRRYHQDRFATAAQGLVQASGIPLIVVGSEREAETIRPVTRLAEHHPFIHSLVGKTPLGEMMAIIQSSSLVIANNSAALHIADAFKRPMVILYSGTEYLEQWQPRHAPARMLYRSVHCSPCFSFECPFQMECMDVLPDEVIHAALQFLHELQPAGVPNSASWHGSGQLDPEKYAEDEDSVAEVPENIG